MTPEAALAKVAYVLGRWKDNATRRRILTYDLRGEITLPAPIERITGEAATFNLQGVTMDRLASPSWLATSAQ